MDDYTNYTEDEEYMGMPPEEREELLKSRRMKKIISVVLLAVICIALIASIIGIVIIVNVNSDSAKGPSNPAASATPTNTPSNSISLAASSSASPSPSAGMNADNKNVNINYYKNAEVHPFNVEDLTRTDRIGEPVTSPDDTMVAFTRYVYNPETNVTSTTLWIRSIQSNDTYRQLTPFGWGISESNPCWSPDSKTVLFISNRDASSVYYPGSSYQVWQINVDGDLNLPTVLSDYPMDVTALMCSNTGIQYAFAANVIPGNSLEDSAAIIAAKESETVRAFTFDKLFIRHWGEWYHGERSHAFLQRIEWNDSTCTLSGDAIDMMGNLDADAPTKPYGGIEEWSFSPDDSEFAFTRRYDENTSVAWTTNLDIFTVSITSDSVGTPVCITQENQAADTQPSYSNDGTLIAYLSQTVPGYESDRSMVKVYNRTSQMITEISENWDRSIDSLVWLPDDSGFYVTIAEYARERIYKLLLNGNYTVVVSEHSSSSLNVLSDESIVFSYESMVEPSNIYLYSSDNITQLTDFNADMLEKTYRSEPVDFWFTGAYDEQVHGWVLNAAQNSAPNNSSTFPVAFLIHGGPQGTWSDDWSYRWNPQTYAGNGYAVAMIDFHGSIGYGQNFTNSITNNYGGAPFYDLNVGLDSMLGNFTFLDSSRQIALGASYGGWMINWINGHQWNGNDRFLCLVCHDGIFDERIFWFNTDELWFPEHDMVGTPFNNSNYEDWNPSRFVDQWKTPQMVIHGGRDYRIPDSHGIGAFTALQRQGIESKFVFFPTENHWVLTPSNSVYWHHTVNDWMDHFAYPERNT